MATGTPPDEIVKQKGMETRESGSPGTSWTVRLEDLQATVESLVQKALAATPTTRSTTPPDGGKRKFEHVHLSQGIGLWEMTRAPSAGCLLIPHVTTG